MTLLPVGPAVAGLGEGESEALAALLTELQTNITTLLGSVGTGAASVTSLTTSGNADIGGTLGVDGAAVFDAGVGVFGHAAPVAASSITGALSTVADAPAKAVLTSIIGALVATGQATNGTT